MPPPSTDFDHESMVEACARGELAALQALYEREASWLLGVAERIVRDRDTAQDVLQDAFMQIWHGASTYRRALGSARGWIYTVVRHRALDARRKAARERPAGDALDLVPDHGFADSAAHPLQARDLHRCLEALPAQHRDCVLRAFVEGDTHEQIAARLAAPLGSVKSWIRRGLLALRECLS